MKSLNKKHLANHALISVLKKCSPDVRETMINFLNAEGLRALAECTYNVLYSQQISKSHKNRLKKHCLNSKKDFKKICKKKISIKERRRLLTQNAKGSGLGTILAIGGNILSNLLWGHS